MGGGGFEVWCFKNYLHQKHKESKRTFFKNSFWILPSSPFVSKLQTRVIGWSQFCNKGVIWITSVSKGTDIIFPRSGNHFMVLIYVRGLFLGKGNNKGTMRVVCNHQCMPALQVDKALLMEYQGYMPWIHKVKSLQMNNLLRFSSITQIWHFCNVCTKLTSRCLK